MKGSKTDRKNHTRKLKSTLKGFLVFSPVNPEAMTNGSATRTSFKCFIANDNRTSDRYSVCSCSQTVPALQDCYVFQHQHQFDHASITSYLSQSMNEKASQIARKRGDRAEAFLAYFLDRTWLLE